MRLLRSFGLTFAVFFTAWFLIFGIEIIGNHFSKEVALTLIAIPVFLGAWAIFYITEE